MIFYEVSTDQGARRVFTKQREAVACAKAWAKDHVVIADVFRVDVTVNAKTVMILMQGEGGYANESELIYTADPEDFQGA